MSLYKEVINEEEHPVVFANNQGVITKVNGRFEEIFLWSADRLIGKPISTIIPEGLHTSHNMGFARYILTGQSTLLNTPLELQVLLGNGEIILAEHLIVSFEEDGEKLFAAKITIR